MVTKDNASNLRNYLGILVENLTENPRTLSLDEVKRELAKIVSESSFSSPDVQKIDLMVEVCVNIQQKHVRVLNKFIKSTNIF